MLRNFWFRPDSCFGLGYDQQRLTLGSGVLEPVFSGESSASIELLAADFPDSTPQARTAARQGPLPGLLQMDIAELRW